jgi:hypothetical protein
VYRNNNNNDDEPRRRRGNSRLVESLETWYDNDDWNTVRTPGTQKGGQEDGEEDRKTLTRTNRDSRRVIQTRLETLVCFYYFFGSTNIYFNIYFTVILRVGTETTSRTPGTQRVHQECNDDKQGLETRLYDASRARYVLFFFYTNGLETCTTPSRTRLEA